jgi:RND family efflux transporter MFP subunit
MVEGAAARIRQAKAGLASAAVTRKDAVVTAPSDGVITAKFVEEGALASPGMPLLGMDTLRGYRVDAVLPETYFGEVRPGLQVSVKVPASGAGPLRGTIRTIVPAADPRSRSFVLKVTLEEEPPVTSGMFARVEVPIGRAAAILIPPEAVVRKGQLTGLFVLGDGEIARFRLVRLGRMVQGGVEVLSGLEKGERFASPADPRLKDGVRVETKP